MPNFTAEQMREIMDRTDNIRSLSVIAQVDHGKSTVTDLLICKAGIIAAREAMDTCFVDRRAEEEELDMTIKSTAVSLYFELEEDGGPPTPHLINLIDSPGHADFSPEVTAALRITDGALVVVDCIEGCAVQTEAVLRQALQERVKPCLFLNKVDRCILELQMEPEDMFQRFRKAIEDLNVITATYDDQLMRDNQVDPEKGTVAFGSSLHGWGFTIERFAKIYAAKMGVDRDKMTKRLWGDNFYDREKKVWTNVMQPEGATQALPRAFCQFILRPITQLMHAIMNDDKAKYEIMLSSLGISLKGDDKNLTGKPLMKRTMRAWINAADTLLSMIVTKLPSPRQAQKYRVENLYEGPMDDAAASAIRSCDAAGPLMMYVSKMVPRREKGRFYAFGRVFSGTIATGQRVRIQGPCYKVGSDEDLNVKRIPRIVLMMGRSTAPIADMPCGNIVALVGLDQFILKSGTITTREDAHNIADMKYSVSPVVKAAVKPKDARDLPKLVEGLRKLSKSDPLVVCTTEESGEHVIAACGELALEICLKELREELAKCDLVVSNLTVSYRETVQEQSSQTVLATSPNSHNRLYLQAEPIPEELTVEIEGGKAGPKADAEERSKLLHETYDWDENQARKIWCWGPENEGANLVVDTTVGIQYVNEIKEHVNSAFQWATKEGPLCGESMRGIKFNIKDVTLHADAIHRGAGQIMPAMRRACFAAEMMGKPTLQEPVFLVEITCPREAMSEVHACMNQRRGHIFEETPRRGTTLMKVKAHLPVAESFCFGTALRQQTRGQAFSHCVFDHWDTMQGNAMEAGRLQEIVLALRKRKYLEVKMPSLDQYL